SAKGRGVVSRFGPLPQRGAGRRARWGGVAIVPLPGGYRRSFSGLSPGEHPGLPGLYLCYPPGPSPVAVIMAHIIFHLLLAALLPPLLLGVINRTKAIIGGRTGQPLLQPYFDLIKLWRKGSVFSTTTTWVFRAGPVVTFAATVL